MLRIEVNIKDLGASKSIADIIRACKDRQAMHEAAGAAVEGEVKDYLEGLNSRSPNTSFYARAARSVEVKADNRQALVSITQRGMALRYYGGRVLPGKSISSFTGQPTKALAIPSGNVPMAGNEGRKRPGEMGILAFLPSKKAGAIGVLVEGELVARKRKPGQRVKPKDGGRLMYVLRSWTDHKQDPSILPTKQELTLAAIGGIRDYFEATTGEPLT